MADLTVVALLDRIHAINGTITLASGTLTPFRFFPREWTAAGLPAIFPLLAPATYEPSAGKGPIRGVRQVKLLAPVGRPNAGLLTETAQNNAELVIDPIIRTYRLTPLLQLSNTALDGVTDVAVLTQDTGIVLSPLTGLFQVEFTLVVPVIAYQSS